MRAAAADSAAAAQRARLPLGYAVAPCAAFDAPGLAALSAAFAAEDVRVGRLPSVGRCGGVAGQAALLLEPGGQAVGYVFHYANTPPPWAPRAQAAASLPPRLAHLFISQPYRRRGLGSALLAWWRAAHATPVAIFAVDSPNAAMRALLASQACAPAQRASGHAATSLHFLSGGRGAQR